jgi:hypothetical protein
MEYRNKYLKYKQKYINLKNQNGGICSTCPKWGFKQHLGECWHDSISNNLLYSDDLSEIIQEIFDNPDFNVDDIIDKAHNNPTWLIPINVEESDYDYFIYNAKEYILNLKLRYDNQKAEGIKTKPPRDPRLRPKSTRITMHSIVGGVRPRRDSINESLKCTLAIFNITNINIYDKFIYSKLEHGGNYLIQNTIFKIFNYFLLNYNNETKIYKTLENIIINKLNILNKIDTVNINKLIFLLDEFKKKLITIRENFEILNSLNILINILDNYHVIGLFKCNNIEYFYDNNSIKDNIYRDISSEDDIITNFKEISMPQQFEFSENIVKQYIEFKWKDNLKKSINDIIENDIPNILNDIKLNNYDNINNNINIINIKLFSFYEDHIYSKTEQYIGQKYLKDSYIKELFFTIFNNNTTEEQYNEYYIYDNLMYKNKRSNKFIVDNIIINKEILNRNYYIIKLIEKKINKNDILGLELIKDKLFKLYLENKDILLDNNINIINNIKLISINTGLMDIIKNIDHDYKNIIDETFILMYIKNPLYSQEDKLKEIKYIYKTKNYYVYNAINNLLLNKEYIFEIIYPIITNDFFDINYINSNNDTILNALYNSIDDDSINIEYINKLINIPKLNINDGLSLKAAINASLRTNNIIYIKILLESDKFDSNIYNKIQKDNSDLKYFFNDFSILNYKNINDINREIFDLLIEKKIIFDINIFKKLLKKNTDIDVIKGVIFDLLIDSLIKKNINFDIILFKDLIEKQNINFYYFNKIISYEHIYENKINI